MGAASSSGRSQVEQGKLPQTAGFLVLPVRFVLCRFSSDLMHSAAVAPGRDLGKQKPKSKKQEQEVEVFMKHSTVCVLSLQACTPTRSETAIAEADTSGMLVRI